MTEERAKRKLSAILSADVKGYSRLMGEDELATVRTLEAYREMIGEVIRNYSGRVVDSPGDNVLAEFASVVDAVESAVEIQQELKAKNAELPENRRMAFRIGINLGDVIEEGERIYGDGVNIAARIESLAAGGGICISGTAFDQVEGKLRLEFEYLGEEVVRNIKKPVRLYRVRMEGSVSDVETRQKLPLPDKPSIAVLPFVNMSGDPEQEYFSDGISEEIITALSKTPKLFVIARNSTFSYKGKAVKVQRVAKELGVQYVLEGSVRKSGDRVRISAQLIDALKGHHLWAERYDRKPKDFFDLQDEITLKILNSLHVKLTEGEQARIYGKGTNNLEAYIKVLQGRDYYWRLDREGNILAKSLFEEAIALDPQYPAPYWLLGMTHMMDAWFSWGQSLDDSLSQAMELAKKTISLDESDSNAHGLLGAAYRMKMQHDKAIAEGERAVAFDPNSADAHVWLGIAFNFADRAEDAVPLLEKAIRLNPFAHTWYFLNLGTAYRLSERYEEAIAAYQRALRLSPNNLHVQINLTTIYSLLGRDEEASVHAAEVLRISPEFSLASWEEKLPYKNQARKQSDIDALRKAGLN